MASARPWNAMLIAAEGKSSMIPAAAALLRERKHSPFIPADAGIQPLPNRTTYDFGKDWVPASAGTSGLWETPPHFGGLNSFQGSLTLGILSNSTLASLPSFISTLRM